MAVLCRSGCTEFTEWAAGNDMIMDGGAWPAFRALTLVPGVTLHSEQSGTFSSCGERFPRCKTFNPFCRMHACYRLFPLRLACMLTASAPCFMGVTSWFQCFHPNPGCEHTRCSRSVHRHLELSLATFVSGDRPSSLSTGRIS